MSHLSGLYIHIAVSTLQNHLRSRGRSSVCEHEMVSGWVGGKQQQKAHVEGIYELLWGMTDKNGSVWAVLGDQLWSAAVSVCEVWVVGCGGCLLGRVLGVSLCEV